MDSGSDNEEYEDTGDDKYAEYDDLQDADYNPNNKLGGRIKRNTEKDSLGRYHEIVSTEEGSEMLHQWKESHGMGGASLEMDQLAEVFGNTGQGAQTDYAYAQDNSAEPDFTEDPLGPPNTPDEDADLSDPV